MQVTLILQSEPNGKSMALDLSKDNQLQSL